MSYENTTATSNKRTHEEVDSANSPVSTLKKTRIDAQSADISRVKWRANSNSNTIPGAPSKAQTKMEKRLEPLAPLLASLPKPLSIQFKEFATLILSRKIDIIHCEKRTQFTELNRSLPIFHS